MRYLTYSGTVETAEIEYLAPKEKDKIHFSKGL